LHVFGDRLKFQGDAVRRKTLAFATEEDLLMDMCRNNAMASPTA
jgi:hypothetical protein